MEVLELLAPYVSRDDERIQEGMQIVLEKQDEHGRWLADRQIHISKTWPTEFEEEDQPSKWVTLHAINMLKRLYV